MTKITIYQFRLYDIAHDENLKSRRWATLDAIKNIHAEVLKDTATEVDAPVVATDHAGMTVVDFNPHPRSGFQKAGE